MMNFIKDYGSKDVVWSIGSLFSHDDMIMSMTDACIDMKVDTPIRYVYGSIPCDLSGGKVPPLSFSLDDCYSFIDVYNSRNISCRLTFTRMDISDALLEDELSNNMLSKLDSNNKELGSENGVIVSSDKLLEYIRKSYPNLKVISSLLRALYEKKLGDDTKDYYEDLLDKYDIVNVNPAIINLSSGFCHDLKDKDRLEWVVNSRCVPGCPFVKECFDIQQSICDCIYKKKDFKEYDEKFKKIMSNCLEFRRMYPFAGTSLSYSDINMLVDCGYRRFNVCGRDVLDDTFARDLGDYIFDHSLFIRMLNALAGRPM